MPMFYGKEYDICIRFTCSRNWLAAREWAGNFFQANTEVIESSG